MGPGRGSWGLAGGHFHADAPPVSHCGPWGARLPAAPGSEVGNRGSGRGSGRCRVFGVRTRSSLTCRWQGAGRCPVCGWDGGPRPPSATTLLTTRPLPGTLTLLLAADERGRKDPARCGRAGVEGGLGAQRPRAGDEHCGVGSCSGGAALLSVTSVISCWTFPCNGRCTDALFWRCVNEVS